MVPKNGSKKGITLVIGSGAIKCAASIGMWQTLVEENIQVDMVVGCSAGSIYGAGIAMGMSVDEIKMWSERTWTKGLMQDYLVNLKASKDGTLKFTERSGLVDDSILNSRIKDIFQDTTFAELEKQFIVVATNMLNGEKVSISNGKLFDAIRASIALPLIFPPWEIEGQLLVDGAASDPFPIDTAIKNGADIIIAMGFTIDYRKRFSSLTAVQEQMTAIYMNNILKSSFAFNNLAHHSEIFTIIPEFDESLSMFDVHKIPKIIERGAEATRKQIPHIKSLLNASS
jgi:NTE family protein